jgi:hypothetical protein
MVHRFSAMVMLGAALTAAGAPRLKDNPGPSPLVGKWLATETFKDGTDTTVETLKVEYVFGADGELQMQANGKTVAGGRYTTNNSAKPSILRFTGLGGVFGQQPAICEVAGNDLVVAWSTDGGVTPPGFGSGRKNTIVIHFSRVKD